MDKNLLNLALKNSYCEKTSYPDLWFKNNPVIGQCAVASMVVQDSLGGKIVKVSLPNLPYTHYFNIIEEEVIDFTKNQFSDSYLKKKNFYKDYKVKKRNKISGKNIQNRYSILKKKVEKFFLSFYSLKKKIGDCQKCDFVEHLKGPIIKIGSNHKYLFVGEAPAQNGWRKSGKAFFNPEGKLLPTGRNLIKMLNVLDINLEEITYTEVIKCTPNKRKYLKKAAINCRPFLIEQINLINPDIIIPLGSYASIYLTETLGVRENRSFKKLKGKLLKSDNFLILPLQHPSPANPYGLKFNIPVLENFINSDEHKKKVKTNIFIDSLKK